MRALPIVVLAAGVAFLASRSSHQEKDFGKRPDWTLPAPDGSKVSASDFDGKVVILDFWASWCPPCRQEVPGFIELQKKYKEKGLVMLGFSFDKDPETHAAWIKEHGLNYTSIFCGTSQGKQVVAEFEKLIGEIEGIPTTLVIDRRGHIVYKHVGYGPPGDFEKVIEPLLEKN